MILAWGLFIIGMFFATVNFNKIVKNKNNQLVTINGFWGGIILALVSAQYIWG